MPFFFHCVPNRVRAGGDQAFTHLTLSLRLPAETFTHAPMLTALLLLGAPPHVGDANLDTVKLEPLMSPWIRVPTSLAVLLWGKGSTPMHSPSLSVISGVPVPAHPPVL